MPGRVVYLDSSIVLRKLRNQPGAVEDWSEWVRAIASELMEIEILRSLDRATVSGSLSPSGYVDRVLALPELLAKLEIFPLTSAVLKRAARPLSVPLGTLDAIHLATALLWVEENEQDLTFATHDKQLALAARVSGLQVLT